MRVFGIILFLFQFNLAFAAGESCRDLFVLAAQPVYQPAIDMDHIRGDLVTNQDGVTVIAGGLHTWDGLNKFLKKRPELTYFRQRVSKNGVTHIILPEEAFTNRAWDRMLGSSSNEPGGKTLFPQTWQEALIKQAIYHVIKNGSYEKHSGGAEIYVGTYNQVRLRVVFREGEFLTAYPFSNQ